MKVLLTGGTGFVGQHLAERLAEDHQVTLGGRHETDLDFDFLEMDVTRPETLDFSGFDAVVHLVGLSPLHRPEASYHRVHVEGTENVVEACEEAGIDRLIHMSALGADASGPTEYLRTKGEAQVLVEDSELDWTVFRPSVIFGGGGEFLSFIESVLTPFISFVPSGARFQPIHVEDVAGLFTKALEDDEHIGESYSVGGPETYSLREIAGMIGGGLVVPVPLSLTWIGFRLAETAGFRYGMDQYRSLKIDNTVDRNDVEKFGVDAGELKTLEEYLSG